MLEKLTCKNCTEISNNNFIKISKELLKDNKYNSSDIIVFARISSYFELNNEYAFCSSHLLASTCNMSERTIKRVLKKLLDNKLIEIKKEKNVQKIIVLDKKMSQGYYPLYNMILNYSEITSNMALIYMYLLNKQNRLEGTFDQANISASRNNKNSRYYKAKNNKSSQNDKMSSINKTTKAKRKKKIKITFTELSNNLNINLKTAKKGLELLSEFKLINFFAKKFTYQIEIDLSKKEEIELIMNFGQKSPENDSSIFPLNNNKKTESPDKNDQPYANIPQQFKNDIELQLNNLQAIISQQTLLIIQLKQELESTKMALNTLTNSLNSS